MSLNRAEILIHLKASFNDLGILVPTYLNDANEIGRFTVATLELLPTTQCERLHISCLNLTRALFNDTPPSFKADNNLLGKINFYLTNLYIAVGELQKADECCNQGYRFYCIARNQPMIDMMFSLYKTVRRERYPVKPAAIAQNNMTVVGGWNKQQPKTPQDTDVTKKITARM